MSHEAPGVRVIIERRSEFTAGDDHEQAKKAAIQKTSGLLFAWRSRLTEEALQTPKQYGDTTTIHSPTPGYVNIVVADNEKITRYNFNGETGDVTMRHLPAHADALIPDEPLPNDLVIHEQLSRVLFDCERIEMRG
jgi:hypothetical protein